MKLRKREALYQRIQAIEDRLGLHDLDYSIYAAEPLRSCEGLMHEIAHAVVLYGPLAAWPDKDLSGEIARKLRNVFGPRDSDHSEILTCAVEICTFERLGWHMSLKRLVQNASGMMRTEFYGKPANSVAACRAVLGSEKVQRLTDLLLDILDSVVK